MGDIEKREREEYVSVFDRMLDIEKRKAFIDRKRSSYSVSEKEVAELEAYIMSGACTDEIKRLRDGDFRP